jgi:hypothetical protein
VKVSEKIAAKAALCGGLPWGRLKEKNDLFVSLKASFLLPFRYQQQAVDASSQ